MEDVQKFVTPLIENVEQVIVGKRQAIEFIMVALLCEGHVLLEDVPGSGKTMLARAIADGWQSILSRLEGKRILPPSSLISLRSLDPRRRIYFFYLAMIHRGGEQGLTRKPSQTPSEYAVTLEKALPAAGEDIDSITEAFVKARYSRQEVDASNADVVKATWGRIRRALQSKSKNA